MFVSFAQLCVVYVVKEVASFRELGQLMGVARKTEKVRLSYRPAESFRRINNYIAEKHYARIFNKYMYYKLLSFRHDEVIF